MFNIKTNEHKQDITNTTQKSCLILDKIK
jgi:hypothetical protein